MPAKPKLGQNFLNDAQATQRIAAALGDISGQTVVEIGPGQGAITRALAARAAHVLAIELDPHLAVSLRAYLPPDRVTVIEQDVLNFDFAEASKHAGRRLPLAGNLPYYITSPILLARATTGCYPSQCRCTAQSSGFSLCPRARSPRRPMCTPQ